MVIYMFSFVFKVMSRSGLAELVSVQYCPLVLLVLETWLFRWKYCDVYKSEFFASHACVQGL